MEKKWFNTDFPYDVESYPNCFTMTIIHASGKWLRQYEISDRKNDIEELANCLRYLIRNKCRMVGFNNISYDYHLIHHIIAALKTAKKNGKPPKVTAQELYKLTKKIIEGMREDGRGSSVKDEDVIIPQVDLFKINHYDNKAKMTSLKMLEFNMRSENIEDLPFTVGKMLTSEEMDVLLEYNEHDVMQTLKFYYYCYDMLVLRNDLSESMGWDVTNFNDSKIGSELFVRSLEKDSPGICYTQTGRGRKINQTKRDKIIIKDCLLNYYNFEFPEFKAVHYWLKSQVITSTLGVFSDIMEHNLGDVAKYAQMEIKRFKLNDPEDSKNKRYVPDQSVYEALKKEYPLGWVEEKELKSPKGAKSYYWCYKIAENLNVVINGYRYDFGVGGIHGAIQGTVKSSSEEVIKTYDVASYYPNLSIANKIYPKHLGEKFCVIYKGLYDERKKHAKGTAFNGALKLALNASYGNSNNEFSPLYDPAYTMAITINGQLSLCMLTEKLIKHCEARMLMHNTDGLEFMVHPSQDERVKKVVAWWEKVTGLEMEGDEYEKMFVRDVNSYISVTKSGKVKSKGAYEVESFDKIGWHKNQSAMIIPMAVKEYLVNGVDYVSFVKNHKDIYDFMLRAKIPRSSRLVLVDDYGVDVPQQNICRYYPSKKGGSLVKIMPALKLGEDDRRLSIDKEWKVKTCNNILDFDGDIDYDYYITEIEKLIEPMKKDVSEDTPF